MAEFPALPIFTDAYMADTRHLSTAEHGAYFLLLMTAWRSPDCGLPDDDVQLGRIVGDTRNWKKMRPVIFAMWHLNGGRWYQKKLLSIRENVLAKSLKAKHAANIKHQKNNNSGDADAQPEHVPQPANQNQNHKPKERITPLPPAEPEASAAPAGAASPENPTMLFPYAGPRQPAGWGTWVLEKFPATPKDAIAEQWGLFSEYWSVGKGKKTKRTAVGWKQTWQSWCRKEFEKRYGGAIPQAAATRPAAAATFANVKEY